MTLFCHGASIILKCRPPLFRHCDVEAMLVFLIDDHAAAVVAQIVDGLAKIGGQGVVSGRIAIGGGAVEARPAHVEAGSVGVAAVSGGVGVHAAQSLHVVAGAQQAGDDEAVGTIAGGNETFLIDAAHVVEQSLGAFGEVGNAVGELVDKIELAGLHLFELADKVLGGLSVVDGFHAILLCGGELFAVEVAKLITGGNERVVVHERAGVVEVDVHLARLCLAGRQRWLLTFSHGRLHGHVLVAAARCGCHDCHEHHQSCTYIYGTRARSYSNHCFPASLFIVFQLHHYGEAGRQLPSLQG